MRHPHSRVNQGERLLDLGRKTEIATEPQLTALNQMIKLGKLNRTTSYEEKDKLQVRDCRIISKKRSTRTPGHAGQFADVASLTPPLYLDSNEIMRHQVGAEMRAKAKPAPKKVEDHDTQKATLEETVASRPGKPTATGGRQGSDGRADTRPTRPRGERQAIRSGLRPAPRAGASGWSGKPSTSVPISMRPSPLESTKVNGNPSIPAKPGLS
jgi:hypothetical protein